MKTNRIVRMKPLSVLRTLGSFAALAGVALAIGAFVALAAAAQWRRGNDKWRERR